MVEVLARKIRQENEKLGAKEEVSPSIFTGDMILYVENLKESIILGNH